MARGATGNAPRELPPSREKEQEMKGKVRVIGASLASLAGLLLASGTGWWAQATQTRPRRASDCSQVRSCRGFNPGSRFGRLRGSRALVFSTSLAIAWLSSGATRAEAVQHSESTPSEAGQSQPEAIF